MTKTTKTVLAVVLGLFVFGCLGTGAVALLLVGSLGSLGGDGQWRADAVPERELKPLFGVRLSAPPVRYQGRLLGFQDAHYEVLVQLPAGGVETFLTTNGLVRGEKGAPDADVVDAIRALEPSTPALDAVTLTLPRALQADGGEQNLHRRGELLEGPGGVTWLYLVAFET
jgi:hypothetical protein